MKRLMSLLLIILTAGFTCTAGAVIIELPLNCAGTYQGPGPSYWEYNFDLGVQFAEITSVSIAWSGKITAAILRDDLGNIEIADTHFMAWLGNMDATAEVFGGSSAYPDSETFNEITYFTLRTNHTWNDLLDGKSRILMEENYYVFILFGQGGYVVYGKTEINNAALYVEGTLVPEPAAGSLLLTGGLLLWEKRKGTP